MVPIAEFMKLRYHKLTPDELRSIADVIYRATELEDMLNRLALALTVGRDATPREYETEYYRSYGSSDVIGRVRRALPPLTEQERRGLTLTLDHAADLLAYRHGLAHGLPRVSEAGERLMWRKRTPRPKQPRARHEEFEAVPIDPDSLGEVARLLAVAHKAAFAAALHFQPSSLGEVPGKIVEIHTDEHTARWALREGWETVMRTTAEQLSAG
ncbi:hypothetical protein [Cellulosimicrobium cellulans]|uniref:hypothetical protein n=1 Tax=Cellulosimicrobium cellulans TaxID=1710 RepID=UPI002097671D|nr:hypothetical protein [Cellulosimicrobium cellulans]MCO7273340.1 hypothetical protein [Cellulosimicrobium cellulans]